jgi:hypothetical protein
MEDQDIISGMPQMDVMKLITKRKKRYLAIILNEIEEEKLSPDQYSKIRKIVLDGFNSYTRGLFTIVGIDVEGLVE